jgi:LEA14-like dessication related protein
MAESERGISVRAIATAALLLLFAGCSALLPRLETPSLSIVNVELLKSDMGEQRMRVRMRVQNPNDRALPIKGLSYALEVAGEDFAHGVSAASFLVPAMGEAEFDMNITANMASTLIKFLGRGGDSAADEVDYRIKGRISLSQGVLRSIPFEERGRFKLR